MSSISEHPPDDKLVEQPVAVVSAYVAICQTIISAAWCNNATNPQYDGDLQPGRHLQRNPRSGGGPGPVQ